MTSKRVIITAGPTSEPIDQVRRLTNHSTGSLGSQLAERCREEGYEVVMLRSRHCVVPPPRGLDQVIPFETTDDLLARLKELSKFPACALFHAAAVSDFKPGGIFVEGEGGWNALSEGKVSSRQEQVMLRLVPTSKIIAQLRSWFPNACLVGWKYEVEGTCQELAQKAMHQLSQCQTHYCVLNGPCIGDTYRVFEKDLTHPAELSDKDRLCDHLIQCLSKFTGA